MEKFAAAAAHPPRLGGGPDGRGTAPDPGDRRGDGDGGRGRTDRAAGRGEPGGGRSPTVAAGPEPVASGARRGHWREDKIGLLMTMTSEESAMNPGPTIPENFVDPLRIIKLCGELKKGLRPRRRRGGRSPGVGGGRHLGVPGVHPAGGAGQVDGGDAAGGRILRPDPGRGRPGFGASIGRSARRSRPTAPRPIGPPRAAGSATSRRSWISSTALSYVFAAAWRVAASRRGGRSMCGGSAGRGKAGSRRSSRSWSDGRPKRGCRPPRTRRGAPGEWWPRRWDI